MRKYLLTGLFIILAANVTVLTNVIYNRTGEVQSQLNLTERELSLPYNHASNKDNSAKSLQINWRVAEQADNNYSGYRYQSMKMTKQALFALGFEPDTNNNSSPPKKRELYWAMELNGAHYQNALTLAETKHQDALKTYQHLANDKNKKLEQKSKEKLLQEQHSKSRLFFLEAAKNYQTLADKFAHRKNVIIVKGLTSAYFSEKGNSFELKLHQLAVKNIMVPAKFNNHLNGLTRKSWNDNTPPRYSVSVSWGRRFEPWIANLEKI